MSDLFGGAPAPKPSRIKGTRPRQVIKDDPIPDAPAVARKIAVMTPEEYERSWDAIREGIVDRKGVDVALAFWNTEEKLRRDVGLDLRQERLIKAALDGRCNRIKAGIIPPGRD